MILVFTDKPTNDKDFDVAVYKDVLALEKDIHSCLYNLDTGDSVFIVDNPVFVEYVLKCSLSKKK